MASKIEMVCRQAMKTFARTQRQHPAGSSLDENLRVLSSYANKLTASDVCLEESLRGVRGASKASVTYIRIYEDPDVSVGIFVLKPQASLPLHNHPGMRGVLKVLLGQVEVQSYTPLDTAPVPTVPRPWDALFCEKHDRLAADAASEVCTLGARRNNLHAISNSGAAGQWAAFLDILAPPYSDAPDENGEERDCFYYEAGEPRRLEDKLVSRLVRIPAPQSYTCDSAQYLGPAVQERRCDLV